MFGKKRGRYGSDEGTSVELGAETIQRLAESVGAQVIPGIHGATAYRVDGYSDEPYVVQPDDGYLYHEEPNPEDVSEILESESFAAMVKEASSSDQGYPFVPHIAEGNDYAALAHRAETEGLPKVVPGNDPVSPSHYKFSNGVEVIDISENLTSNGAQALQYIARATRIDGKNKAFPLEDLNKAVWFIQREIQRIENRNEGRNV